MENSVNEKILDLLQGWYDSPVTFAKEAFMWGHGELAEWEGLDKWQEDFLNDLGGLVVKCRSTNEAVRMAVASGNGIGKSALLAVVVLWFMVTRPNARVRVTANTEAQLNSATWRELALWHQRLICREWFVWEKTSFYHVAYPNNWRAEAFTWSENNPDAFAGLHADNVMLIMDEASGIAQSIWEAALGYMTTAGAIHLAFGNPLRPSGGFYDCFHGKTKKSWNTRNIDSRTARAAKNKKFFDELVEQHGEDSDLVRRRVRGLFPRQAASQFISAEAVQEAVDREITREEVANFPIVMGVDVARFGDDRSAIVLRQGPKLLSIETLEGADITEVSEQVIGILRTNKSIVMCYIDEIGIGAGVVDMVRRFDTRAIGVNVSRRPHDFKAYRYLRDELWGRTRDWLNTASIPDHEQLKKELTSPEYSINDQGQVRLERKIDMKRRGLESPDVADAVALTFCLGRDVELDWVHDDEFLDRVRIHDSYTADMGRSITTGY